MILLESYEANRGQLLHMANIAIKFSQQYWQIRKHRYAVGLDYDRYYPIHSLENYVHEHEHGEVYGTPESYGKQVIVALVMPTDMYSAFEVYHAADLALVYVPRVRQAQYYGIWKNVYNPSMENLTYSAEYIDDLINVYQRRPY